MSLTRHTQYFLMTNISRLTVKALEVVQRSSSLAYRNSRCSLSIIARTNNPRLYLRYYFQNKSTPLPEQSVLSNTPIGLTEGERYTLRQISQLIEEELSRACRLHCTGKEQSIIGFAKWLVNELDKKEASVNRIVLWLMAIKSAIAEDYSSSQNTQLLEKFNSRILVLLSIVQPYLHQDTQKDIAQYTQVQLLKLFLNERKAQSVCSVLLFNYYSVLDRNHPSSIEEYLMLSIAEHNTMFEYLNHSLFIKKMHNEYCTIDQMALYNIALEHADLITAQIRTVTL